MSTATPYDAGECEKCGARLVLGVEWCQICFTRVEEMSGAHLLAGLSGDSAAVFIKSPAPPESPESSAGFSTDAEPYADPHADPTSDMEDFDDPGTGVWEAIRNDGDWEVDSFEEGDEVPLTRREKPEVKARGRKRRRILVTFVVIVVLAISGAGVIYYVHNTTHSSLSQAQVASQSMPTIATVNSALDSLETVFGEVSLAGIATPQQLQQVQAAAPAFTMCVLRLSAIQRSSQSAAVSEMIKGCRSYSAAIGDITSTIQSQVLVNTSLLNNDLTNVGQSWDQGLQIVAPHVSIPSTSIAGP